MAKALGSHARVVSETPADADAVIFLGGLKKFKDGEAAAAVNREAFLAAKSFSSNLPEDGGVFVTVQDTGGAFGLTSAPVGVSAWASGLPGLIKTAYREWPQTAVKAIDIEMGKRSAKAVAAALLEELHFGGSALEVGLAQDGTRREPVLEMQQHRADGKKSAGLAPGSVVLVSGGARGVTASTLIEWSRELKLRFVLLGRTSQKKEPLETQGAATDAEIKKALLQKALAAGEKVTPKDLMAASKKILAEREIAATLAAIEANGSDAAYYPVDVQDAVSVSHALETVRKKWGPVAAIVHGAGTLEDKLIADKTPEMFDFVFNTKVSGLRALLTATESDPIEAIVLFSSVAGRYGNVGQSDYAMANEVLNKLAREEAKRRKSCLVRSLNWGPWDGGMVTPALRGHFEKLGVALIGLDAGARFMVEELNERSLDDIEVVIGGNTIEPDMSAREGQAERVYDIIVDPAKYGMLESHKIRGKVVVPFVLALDWFQRIAGPAGLSDIQMLKGISGDCKRLRLIVRGETLQLQSVDGTPHYRAVMGPAETDKRIAAPTGLQPSGIKDAYKGKLLFHGPAFHVIASELQISEDALSAELKAPKPAHWKHSRVVTPAAFLDGGLQMGILLGAHVIGKRVLPTRAGQFILYTREIPERVTCSLRVNKKNDSGLVYDVLLSSNDGTPVAAALAVEATAVPNEPSVSLLPRGKVGAK